MDVLAALTWARPLCPSPGQGWWSSSHRFPACRWPTRRDAGRYAYSRGSAAYQRAFDAIDHGPAHLLVVAESGMMSWLRCSCRSCPVWPAGARCGPRSRRSGFMRITVPPGV